MYIDNFSNRDPSHVMTAKYCVAQNIKWRDDGKLFIANEFVSFACKPLKQKKNYHFANGLEAKAADCLLETKWAGLPYNVGDYIEFNDILYTIDSVELDTTKVTATAYGFMGYNPNIYRTLKLSKVLYINGAIPEEID